MSKISLYAARILPQLSDYLLGNDASAPITRRFLITDLLTLFLNNIPAAEGTFAFVSSGMVWTGDAYASTRAASMTAGRIRVNTTFLSIPAVTARVFTASRDTYIDVLDNLDGTGTLVYTETTNNVGTGSPALAANSVRIGIVVTGASNIASVASINQGQEDKILPIVSSVAYATTDSLGNLICPRDPNRATLGLRQKTDNFTTSSASPVQVTGLSCPVKIPDGRKVKVTAYAPNISSNGAPKNQVLYLYEGAVGVGTQIQTLNFLQAAAAGNASFANPERTYTPSSTSVTFNLAAAADSGGGTTLSIGSNSTQISAIKVELA